MIFHHGKSVLPRADGRDAYADLTSAVPVLGPRRRRRAAEAAARAVAGGDCAAVQVLAGALESADGTIRKIAAQSLLGLTEPAAIDALCSYLLHHDAPDVQTIVTECGFTPQDPKQRALFFIILQRWEEYRNLDFQEGYPLLRAAYSEALPGVKKRVREAIRGSGRSHIFSEIVLPCTTRIRALHMGAAEWEDGIRALASMQRYDDLWRSMFLAPPAQTVMIHGILEKAKWRPSPRDRDLWEEIHRNAGAGTVLDIPVPLRDFGAGACTVSSLVFSPEGDRLFSGSSDGTLTFWDTRDGSILHTERSHAGEVRFLAFAGEFLASGGSDGIRVWNPAVIGTGGMDIIPGNVSCLCGIPEREAFVWGTADGGVHTLERVGEGITVRHVQPPGGTPMTCCIAIPGGTFFASGNADGRVRIWDHGAGTVIAEMKGHTGGVRSLSVSADGRFLASGSSDQTVRVWSVAERKQVKTFRGHTDAVTCVDFGPDSSLVSGSADSTVKIWDTRQNTLRRDLRAHHGTITGLVCTQQGALCVTGSADTTAKIWTLPEGTLLRTLKGHPAGIRVFAVSSRSGILATAGWEGTIRLWILSDGGLIRALTLPDGSIQAVGMIPDGGLLASASSDRTIRLWKVPEGQLVRVLEGHRDSVTALSLLPDSGTLISGSRDRTIILWNSATGKILQQITAQDHSVTALTASPAGDVFASGGWGGELCLWRSADGTLAATWRGHESPVTALACGAGGRILISGSQDRSIRLWNLPTGELHQVLESHTGVITSLAVHPGCDTLASGSADRTVKIWQLPDGEPVQSFTLPEKVRSLIFIEPLLLAAGLYDGSTRILSLSDGRIMSTVSVLTGAVTALTADPQGTILIAGSSGGTLRLWELPWTKPLAATTPDDLSRVEKIIAGLPAGSPARKKWGYIRSLLQGRFRYEIEAGDPVITLEDYDIEIV